jgi:hypothetical protein
MEQSERTSLGQFRFTEVKLKYPHVKSWYALSTKLLVCHLVVEAVKNSHIKILQIFDPN